jgi:hypothetical protein
MPRLVIQRRPNVKMALLDAKCAPMRTRPFGRGLVEGFSLVPMPLAHPQIIEGPTRAVGDGSCPVR